MPGSNASSAICARREPELSADPRLPEVFAAIAELSGEARSARLAALRREDEALARDVESLLAALTAGERRFDSPAHERLPTLPEENPALSALPTEYIGPYRLLREIGRGGMGRVFLAEQEGAEFRRYVAMKTIDQPGASEEAIRRFRDEVRILASLEHPGIARFLDGGRSDDGTWFLALEYVEGEDLLAFVRRRGLDLRQRIELFLQVVDAVDFAHRRLVVHRDLKPSNVLVGTDGNAKLLDFGISKILDAETAADVTQTELRRLTPAYASPEQLRGERVTVASDVYSLGVVLYEMLAGRRPILHRQESGPGSATARREPQPPSTAARQGREPTEAAAGTTTRIAWRELTGDLDAITLKALRPEVESRYPSAAALAEDLRRWLSGRPVAARVGSRRYRVGKFVGRHRLALTAAILATLGLAGGLALALWQARIASRERDRAQVAAEQAHREAASAERVADLLGRVFDAASPFEHPGPIDTRELLERGGAEVTQGLEAEPELKAQLDLQLAEVWLRLGETARVETLVAPAAADLERLRGSSDALTARAWSVLAGVKRAQGKNAEARALLDRALAVQRATLGAEHLLTLRTLIRYGNLLRAEGNFPGARRTLEEVVAGFERLGDGAAFDLAKAVGDLGLVLERVEDWTGAERAHRRSYEILCRLFGKDSPRAAVSLANLASTLDQLGRDEEAIAALEEALRVNQKAFGGGGFPGESIIRNSLAWQFLDAGRPLAAQVEFRRSVAAAQRERGPGHSDVAWPMRGLAEAELAMGQLAAARATYDEALALRTKFHGRQHWEVAQSLVDLAGIAARLHDAEAEGDSLREALAIRRAVLPASHPDLARSVIALGQFLCDHRQPAEGAALLGEGLALAAAAPGLAAETERAQATQSTCAAGE